MIAQATFAQALFDPAEPPPAGLSCWTGAEVTRRFAIYRNNVMVSLIDALADSYPVVQAQVGEEFFRAMAREFVRAAPPASPVLAWYGAGFAEHIAGFAPAAALPWLSDLARLEWARVEALHAADAEPLPNVAIACWLEQPARLGGLRLRLHPALRGMVSPYAVVSLWAAHQHAEPEQVAAAVATVLITQAEAALVLRQDLKLALVPLAPLAVRWVVAVADGATLVQANEIAMQSAEGFDLAATLGVLLRYGLIVGIDSDPEA